MLVAIDAGHGKETAGKRSFDSKFMEWEFNRDIAKRLGQILQAHNLEVVYTAPTSVDISLAGRCRFGGKADIFISIHANAFGNDWNDANGFEIYHAEGSVRGYGLAQNINNYAKLLPLKNRGIKTANFYVLKNTRCPAVLVEHFFYTNKAELLKCNTDIFRQDFAVMNAKGILEYFGIKYTDKISPKNIDSKLALKNKFGFTDETINYLLAYKYGEALVNKLLGKSS